jgi:hypothetical protein
MTMQAATPTTDTPLPVFALSDSDILRIVAWYALVAGLWIFPSHQALAGQITDRPQLQLGERWMESMGLLVCDAQGTPTLLRGLVFDITERRQAEEARRQSWMRWRWPRSSSVGWWPPSKRSTCSRTVIASR